MYSYAKIILFSDNNDAKPNNVESAIASGSNAGDPYAASVSAALSSMNINAGGACASTCTMNNGRKDTTASDVQKLQEQLNDIKEQVKYETNKNSVKIKSFIK